MSLKNERIWLPMHVPPRAVLRYGRVEEIKPYKPQGWVGVDIGINHIAVVS